MRRTAAAGRSPCRRVGWGRSVMHSHALACGGAEQTRPARGVPQAGFPAEAGSVWHEAMFVAHHHHCRTHIPPTHPTHLANVHAVGAHSQRHVNTVIDQQRHAAGAAHLEHSRSLHVGGGRGTVRRQRGEAKSAGGLGGAGVRGSQLACRARKQPHRSVAVHVPGSCRQQ